MARSPLTLAASVASALPRTGVVDVAALSERASGRYDSAVVTLEDARRAVVRVPVDADAADDLRAQVRGLAALTAGVRAVLPFEAPVVLGETVFDGAPAIVTTWLPGYRVDAAQVPPGPGVASALGGAIAAVHDLPTSVVRDAGLPALTAAAVRAEAERLLDRAEATGRLPFGLLRRWSAALAADGLWRFETTVTLGGVDPAAFLFDDDSDDVPVVTGLLSWGGLSVGDAASDLRWIASAPDARTDVLDAYASASHRAPDSGLWERARLHAELEFASWLVHGHAAGAESVVTDAVALLEALDESVRDAPPLAHDSVTVDEAIAAFGRVPATTAVDTSMQTDAYDADALSEYTTDPAGHDESGEDTAPIDMSDWSPQLPDTTDGDDDDNHDPDRAARNALRRWTETA